MTDIYLLACRAACSVISKKTIGLHVPLDVIDVIDETNGDGTVLGMVRPLQDLHRTAPSQLDAAGVLQRTARRDYVIVIAARVACVQAPDAILDVIERFLVGGLNDPREPVDELVQTDRGSINIPGEQALAQRILLHDALELLWKRRHLFVCMDRVWPFSFYTYREPEPRPIVFFYFFLFLTFLMRRRLR